MCHFMSKCHEWEGLVGIWSPTQCSAAPKDFIRDILTPFFCTVGGCGCIIHLYSDQYSQLRVDGDETFEFFGSSLISFSAGNRSDGRAAEVSCSFDLFDHSHPVKAAAFMRVKRICSCFVPWVWRSQTGSRCYSGRLRSPICDSPV